MMSPYLLSLLALHCVTNEKKIHSKFNKRECRKKRERSLGFGRRWLRAWGWWVEKEVGGEDGVVDENKEEGLGWGLGGGGEAGGRRG